MDFCVQNQVIFVPMNLLLQSHPWMHHLKWEIVILKSLKSVEFHSTVLTGVSLRLIGSHHSSNWCPWLSVHQSHCHVFKFLKHNHWCFHIEWLLSSFTRYVYYVLVVDHPGDVGLLHIEWLLSNFTSHVYYVHVVDPGDVGALNMEWFILGLQRTCCWNNSPWLQQLLRKWKCWNGICELWSSIFFK